MKNIIVNGFEYLKKLESKIAFYPTVYSLVGVSFAFFMYYIENKGVSGYLMDHVPLLVINNTETAFSILTTFIAGLISIMVFSFSMVMVLLNQASSNFSPRVLPSLISNKRHQKILGIYNATLLYCIFTMVSIEPDGDKYQLPGFSVLLAIVLMVVCLGAFIYFIHSISQEIQVHNIMQRIFSEAKNRLDKLITSEKDNSHAFPETDNWTTFSSVSTGFLQDIILDPVLEFAKNNDCKFHVVAIKGQYVYKDSPLFKCNTEIEDEALEDLLSFFQFSRDEVIEDNYILGFKQITEIAVKAMSPGINDPGTAEIAIDYLTELFEKRMQKQDVSVLQYNNEALVKISALSFKDLLFSVLAPIRTYSKHDVMVVVKLIHMLNHLAFTVSCNNKSYSNAVYEEASKLFEDAKKTIVNPEDVKLITQQLKPFNL
ncbi:DUF2254 domain-containing protein [Olleya sp. HaHaR_3_96]|uniref:DUF2254 domain-containing protein n=1 Tax=Olleya sp. HaHaR_3_96 TaxID=2745560 RepID=UPI001C4EBB5B|nr:DUF2254 domain-containing protein [Olleya sp. HaHaR_3_96]QXP61239.1 DUF2254 domain-containing protein [Olleya sp. HaHaR_3_96]